MHKALSLVVLLLATCATLRAADQPAPAAPPGASNPLVEPSTLPYGLPRFDAIRDADFEPAFESAMAEQRSEVDAIARNPEAATFENTLVALERSGRMLDRVNGVFTNLNASNTDPELQKIELRIAPRLSEHRDGILLNRAVFDRIEAVYGRRADLGLDPESMQLVQRYHTTFVRAGARLDDAGRVRLRELNRQIAELGTRFEQNVRRATNEAAVVVDDRRLLQGLSDEQIGAAREAARARGLPGKWLIALQNTTIQPVLAQLEDRALRERIYRASIGRCDGGDADNVSVVAGLVRLRAERARLLGYPNHAAYALEDEGAGNTAAVNRMLADLASAATRKARAEAAELQALIDARARAAHARSFRLEPWDWAYYEELARKRRFGFEDADVKPYFELDRVLRDGVFYAAHGLYGLTFKERADLPRYQPDVRIYEVFDADGSPLALLLADLYARESKQGGAWMDQFVAQSRLGATRAVVVINLNVPKPSEGQPTLLTFTETTTLFHEFGHALHGTLSNVTYPMLGMAATPPDFVEYPSQFNEMWAREPAVVAHYAHHVQTGAPIPRELMESLLAAGKFGQGYAATEYAAAALLDQAWHQIGPEQAPPAARVMAFEKAALQRASVDLAAVPPRYHSPYFAHIFSGGYDAGYYGYTWSEVLARDTGQWFHRHGGLDRANGDFFRAKVLSRGRTEEPKRLFEEFYGGAAEIGPLLEYRGLAAPLHNAGPHVDTR
jgi:peptidyl-dipeptidase Dcp